MNISDSKIFTLNFILQILYMPSILCSNARVKVAQMVKASTVKHLEDPVLNPGPVSYLFSPKKESHGVLQQKLIKLLNGILNYIW